MMLYKIISKATSNLKFRKIYDVILLRKDKFEIQINRNNCFALPLVMVAYVLKCLFTYINLCQIMHTSPSTLYTKMTARKHLKDILLTLMSLTT